jgi:hypothetical protein
MFSFFGLTMYLVSFTFVHFNLKFNLYDFVEGNLNEYEKAKIIFAMKEMNGPYFDISSEVHKLI